MTILVFKKLEGLTLNLQNTPLMTLHSLIYSLNKNYYNEAKEEKINYLIIPSFQLGTHLLNWIFCGPCIKFLKTSTTFHKMTLTGVTLIVTSLLVASPILFLISAAPSMPHSRDGCSHDECGIHHVPPAECTDVICKNAAASIQAKINWKIDVCKDFKSFSCSNQQNSLRAIKSPQEIADNQMLRKLLPFILFLLFITSNLYFDFHASTFPLPFFPIFILFIQFFFCVWSIPFSHSSLYSSHSLFCLYV